MNRDADAPGRDPERVDVGQYCRDVERHLTQVNGGHLVRIVGPAFDLVRRWAEDGVPLSVVYQAIDARADRHRSGSSRRPLRVEFCEADVRESYERWRRAVGVAPSAPVDGAPVAASRVPSLTRHLERVADRLQRVLGAVDLPAAFRDRLDATLAEVLALRDQARRTRGASRSPLIARLGPLDHDVVAAARDAAPADLADRLRREAEADLAPFRDRLVGDVWRQAVDVTVDRLVRDHFRLPTIAL